MNVIPLFNEKDKSRDEIINIKIQIPSEWWDSSYSVNYSEIDNLSTIKYIKRSRNSLPLTPGWNIQKGDYRVKQIKNNFRDYVYYRDMKIKICTLSSNDCYSTFNCKNIIFTVKYLT